MDNQFEYVCPVCGLEAEVTGCETIGVLSGGFATLYCYGCETIENVFVSEQVVNEPVISEVRVNKKKECPYCSGGALSMWHEESCPCCGRDFSERVRTCELAYDS